MRSNEQPMNFGQTDLFSIRPCVRKHIVSFVIFLLQKMRQRATVEWSVGFVFDLNERNVGYSNY